MKFLIFPTILLIANSSDTNEPRSLASLPSQILSDYQISHGGFLLYIIGIIYVFLCIREVCSACFLPSIDYIVEKYDIKPEVAGATILAMGGSAPETFIMFFGTFLAESNIGYSTILGSGAINGMLLVGVCSLSTSTLVDLQWWVIVRDSIFNLILLGVLILFTFNLYVEWYEGLILLFFYAIYAVFMYYNPIIERNVIKYLNLPYDGDDIDYHPLPEKHFPIRRYSVCDLVEFIPNQLNFRKGVLAKMMRNAQLQVVKNSSDRMSELRSKLKHLIYTILQAIEEKKRCSKQQRLDRGVIKKFNGEEVSENSYKEEIKLRIRKLETLKLKNMADTELDTGKEIEILPSSSRLKRLFLSPMILLLKFTVPNTKKTPKLWFLSFLNSLAWIGILSFLLVWWVLELGKSLGIPDGVLGIIILAAGVSIPDLVNALIKTVEGHGEMALSGCLGSNIINFSFGVGLPWFLYGVITGSPLNVSQAIFRSQLVLISDLAISYIFIGGFKWQLSKNLGIVMIFFYLLFLLLYLLFEYNQI